ncbi:hypothetical protein FSP39_001898 [Pinctada imbricata]|uniref:Uncharacterized protein n=1 Tax=Pinctada imbricata TaxID=66713 RepID=A0AA89CAE9_PINIB|nr:hypothetical protein FSP39_001898 [Pinctada imbricata]
MASNVAEENDQPQAASSRSTRKRKCDSKTTNEIKRLLTTNSESEGTRCRNRVLQTTSGSDEIESESRFDPSDFPPTMTSEWDFAVEYFDAMGLSTDVNVDYAPEEFFKQYVQKIICSNNKASGYFAIQNSVLIKSIEKNVREIFDVMTFDVKDLNICATDNSFCHDSLKQVEETERAMEIWFRSSEAVRDPEMMNFFMTLMVHAREFIEKLKKLVVSIKRNSGVPKEANYHMLFVYFIKMFNLQVSFCPDVESHDLVMRGFREQDLEAIEYNITSTPDIVISHRNYSRDEKILAVIESPSKETETYLSTTVTGRHAGDLLVHLPHSAYGDGLLGMIRQQTRVTLTFLQPEEGYLQSLKTGCDIGGKEACMIVNTPCNLLTKEGRNKLIGPLLKLYVIQKWSLLHN